MKSRIYFSTNLSKQLILKTGGVVLLFFFFSNILFSQFTTQHFKEWENLSGALPSSGQLDLIDREVTIFDENNTLLMASTDFNPITQVYELLLQRMDDQGATIWSQNFHIPGFGNVLVGDLHFDEENNLIFTGSIADGLGYQVLTLKTKPTGEILWYQTFNGNTLQLIAGGTKILTDSDGNIYLTGLTAQNVNNLNALLLVYDAVGTLKMSQIFDNGLDDLGLNLYLNDAATIDLLIGNQKSDNTYGLLLGTYSLTTGDLLNTVELTEQDVVLDEITNFHIDNNNNTYVIGTLDDDSAGGNLTGADFLTIKLDANFNIVWIAKEDSGFQNKDKAKSITTDNEGNVYVVGNAQKETDQDFMLVKYLPNGTKDWQVLHNEEGTSEDIAIGVATDFNGNIFVTGQTNSHGNLDFLTLFYDSDGNLIGSRIFNNDFNKDDKILAITEKGGDIVVTGRSKVIEAGEEVLKGMRVKYSVKDIVEFEDEIPSGLFFIENKGQLISYDEDFPEINFYSNNAGAKYFFTENLMSVIIAEIDDEVVANNSIHRVDFTFPNDYERGQRILATTQRRFHHNYYIGSAENHRERVSIHSKLIQYQAFNNIDVEYLGNSAGMMCRYVVKSEGTPADIRFMVNGGENIFTDNDGNLVVETTLQDVVLPKPRAYQLDANGNEITLNWLPTYTITNGNQISFTYGSYDVSKVLVFECAKTPPENDLDFETENMCYSTYLGDNDWDELEDIATFPSVAGEKDFAAVVGRTRSMMFPAGWGDFDAPFQIGGFFDGYITKIGEDGTKGWSTYFGGEESNSTIFAFTGDDRCTAVAVNAANEVYVAGQTNSNDLEVLATGSQFKDESTSTADWKAFVSKFNGDNGFMNWMTYFGTNSEKITPKGAEINSEGHLIIAGNYFDVGFIAPITNNDQFFGSTTGLAFIAEFDETENLVWATRYGPSASMNPNAIVQWSVEDIAIDANDNLLLGGWASDALDLSAQIFENEGNGNYYRDFITNDEDGFIFKFNYPNRQPFWTTYIGGDAFDFIRGIDTDAEGNIYFGGETDSSPNSIPVLASTNPNSFFQGTLEFEEYLFGQFSPNGDQLWTSYLGVQAEEFLWDLKIASDGHIYAAGFFATNAALDDFNDLPVPMAYNQFTPNNPENTNAIYSSGDGTIITFGPDLSPNWRTLIGGGGLEQEMKIGLTGNEKMFLAGWVGPSATDTPLFPTYDPLPDDPTNHFQDTPQGGEDDTFVSVFDISIIETIVSTQKIAKSDFQFDIFPNPTQNQFTLQIDENLMGKNIQFEIIDALGRVISTENLMINASQLSFSKQLASGLYAVKIVYENTVLTQQLIIQ